MILCSWIGTSEASPFSPLRPCLLSESSTSRPLPRPPPSREFAPHVAFEFSLGITRRGNLSKPTFFETLSIFKNHNYVLLVLVIGIDYSFVSHVLSLFRNPLPLFSPYPFCHCLPTFSFGVLFSSHLADLHPPRPHVQYLLWRGMSLFDMRSFTTFPSSLSTLFRPTRVALSLQRPLGFAGGLRRVCGSERSRPGDNLFPVGPKTTTQRTSVVATTHTHTHTLFKRQRQCREPEHTQEECSLLFPCSRCFFQQDPC